MRRIRFVTLLAMCFIALSSTRITAQSGPVAPRITLPMDESSLVALRGTVPANVRSEFDLGEAPAGTQMTHVRLILSRSAAQRAALDKFLAEAGDRSSPNYHKWLTPIQFGKLFGPADRDIAAITGWLEAHGLTVEPVTPGRTDIAFSGTVQQVEATLHTSIHAYDGNGEKFLSNTTDPKIPGALAAVVSSIAQLNTLRPRPHNIGAGFGTYDPNLKKMTPVPAANGSGPRADLTTGSAGSYTLYVVPADAAAIYDTPNRALNPAYTSGTTYDGKGVTIGVAGDAVIQAATVADFRTRFLGDSTQPTVTNVDGTTATGDTDEGYLDTEISGGLAPGAAIHFYTANNLTDAMAQAITDNKVDILSVSFGLCELYMGTGGNQLIYGYYQQAAAQGITVVVSTGDSGSAGCDDPNSESSATSGLAVSGFASTPYNIAVGGTDLGGLLTAFTTYVDATSSTTNYGSAKGYIPEWTWNDSTTIDTTISQDVPSTDSKGKTIIFGAAGGVSNCSTNTSTSTSAGKCTGGYPRPAWQTGPGKFSSDTSRDIPDVSLMSGAGGDNAAWLVCTDDTGPNSSNATITANCTKQSDGQFYFFGFGGTSTAAPAFAGIMAMVQEKIGSRLGSTALEQLYDLSNSTSGAKIFHDISTGNISVVCVSTPMLSPNCAKNTAGSFYLSGYDTANGYDMATGLGSVDAAQLVASWSASPLFFMTASAPPAVAPGTSATSTITVSSDTGYAGTVTLSCALTSSPTGATKLPSCSVSGGASLSSSAKSSTATATVTTTGATAQLERPSLGGWRGAAGGAALALLTLFGIPARRRSWRAMLGIVALLAVIGSLSACGGGGGSSSGGGGGTPGTTAGNYVFTVTGTGSPALASSPIATFTVTVN